MVHSSDRHAREGGYVVPAPRRTDAVGGTLRRAFDPAPDTPAAFASLVRRLQSVH